MSRLIPFLVIAIGAVLFAKCALTAWDAEYELKNKTHKERLSEMIQRGEGEGYSTKHDQRRK